MRLVRATRLASVVSAAYKTPEMIGLSELKITVTKSTSSYASKCTTNHYLYCIWLAGHFFLLQSRVTVTRNAHNVEIAVCNSGLCTQFMPLSSNG